MVIFLLLLCFLCILPVCSIFEGTCPRKDPPPGVLVVSPGIRLVLTCGGDVTVNDAKVVLSGSNGNKKRPTSAGAPTTKRVASSRTASASLQNNESYFSPGAEAGVSSAPGGNGGLRRSDAGGRTVSPRTPCPTRSTTGESDREDEEPSDGGDGGDEEGREGGGVTRGVKVRHQWKWSKLPGQKGDRNWGELTVLGDEAVLSLASVRPTDAGKYSCHRSGEERFAVEVLVADPPESPSLSCYKKSPGSKIRCEWRPQNPVIKHPNCYLVLIKNKTKKRIPCSYSSQHSQCWCALENTEDEQRTLHVASLCVTSILGNATSPPLFFKPLDIVKPDPPSNILARQEEGRERQIRVTWNLPLSWKPEDSFYDIIYEIRYKPLTSTYEEVNEIKSQRSYTITDALPGDEYRIQLRSREEYDGQWSEWSSPVYARSWMDEAAKTDYVMTPVVDLSSLDDLGSGLPDEDFLEGPENDPCLNSDDWCKTLHHMLWISGLFAFLWAILAFYIFRHKDKFLSKLHRLSAITWCGDLSPPSPPAPADLKTETLVTFLPQPYKKRPPSEVQEEEENEEEQTVTGRVEAMNFNNTSYFCLQNEL